MDARVVAPREIFGEQIFIIVCQNKGPDKCRTKCRNLMTSRTISEQS